MEKYAITPCSEVKKSAVLSLSEDVLVKIIKLGNYEIISSKVKIFKYWKSNAGMWVSLGTYRAETGHGE